MDVSTVVGLECQFIADDSNNCSKTYSVQVVGLNSIYSKCFIAVKQLSLPLIVST